MLAIKCKCKRINKIGRGNMYVVLKTKFLNIVGITKNYSRMMWVMTKRLLR